MEPGPSGGGGFRRGNDRSIAGVMEFTVLCPPFALVSEASRLSDRHQQERAEDAAAAADAREAGKSGRLGVTNTCTLAV